MQPGMGKSTERDGGDTHRRRRHTKILAREFVTLNDLHKRKRLSCPSLFLFLFCPTNQPPKSSSPPVHPSHNKNAHKVEGGKCAARCVGEGGVCRWGWYRGEKDVHGQHGGRGQVGAGGGGVCR